MNRINVVLLGLAFTVAAGCQSKKVVPPATKAADGIADDVNESGRLFGVYGIEETDSFSRVRDRTALAVKDLGKNHWIIMSNLGTLLHADRPTHVSRLVTDLGLDLNQKYVNKSSVAGYQTLICETVYGGLQTNRFQESVDKKMKRIYFEFASLLKLGADPNGTCDNGRPFVEQADIFLEKYGRQISDEEKKGVTKLAEKIRTVVTPKK